VRDALEFVLLEDLGQALNAALEPAVPAAKAEKVA